MLEMSLPQININLAIIKDDTISCHPDHPAAYDEYFPEYHIIKVYSCL